MVQPVADPAPEQVSPDTDRRIADVVAPADMSEVADALAAGRDRILAAWLDAASRQPFHESRPEGAVADHIPPLFDAIVDLLRRSTDASGAPPAPLDDEDVAREARAHARARFEQGLGPVSVVTEFRLLRHEISRAIGALLDDHARPSDVVAGLALVGDALDGAATIGLSALSDSIETTREAFLATILHDIRQPVTLVEGSLHLSDRWLRTAPVDTERVHESVGDALAATIELVAMIDTLSDASRLVLGGMLADLEPASLAALVRTAVDAFGAAARERIVVDAPPGGTLIGLWDASLVQRLVTNLIGNAVKYSPHGTQVRVTVEPGAPGYARLIVADEGLGMAPDEIATAFDRFARGSRTRQAGIPGLGLGLYACRGIVTAHEGTIRIESDGPDRGTTVTVELPLIDGSALED
jgi:signal transduction histidine kinase